MCPESFFELQFDMTNRLCNVHLFVWTEVGSSL